MKNKLNWNIFTNKERNEAINCLKDIISSNDGYILNSVIFSDLALNLTVEIKEKNIEKLHSALGKEMDISTLDKSHLDQDAETEWWVFLNITFSDGTGNLKIDVPRVPG